VNGKQEKHDVQALDQPIVALQNTTVEENMEELVASTTLTASLKQAQKVSVSGETVTMTVMLCKKVKKKETQMKAKANALKNFSKINPPKANRLMSILDLAIADEQNKSLSFEELDKKATYGCHATEHIEWYPEYPETLQCAANSPLENLTNANLNLRDIFDDVPEQMELGLKHMKTIKTDFKINGQGSTRENNTRAATGIGAGSAGLDECSKGKKNWCCQWIPIGCKQEVADIDRGGTTKTTGGGCLRASGLVGGTTGKA